jgi:ribosome-binding protein aMBF1 (putative translation factor)
MEHQDWKQYIVHCKQPTNSRIDKKPQVHYEKSNAQKINEMEQEGELKHKKVEQSISKLVQQVRTQKGMTQKELANKVSLSPAIINEIESGKAKYNPAHMNKIKRVLNINMKK